MQHDCAKHGCKASHLVPIRQERLESDKVRLLVKHESSEDYVLNTYSLHNYEAIKNVVPAHLRVRDSVVDDREAHRKLAAQKIRSKKTAKPAFNSESSSDEDSEV